MWYLGLVNPDPPDRISTAKPTYAALCGRCPPEKDHVQHQALDLGHGRARGNAHSRGLRRVRFLDRHDFARGWYLIIGVARRPVDHALQRPARTDDRKARDCVRTA